MINIKNNLAEIKQQIRDCEILFAREPFSVTLVAVSKGQSIEKIEQAVLAGQTAFAENHLQEALPKIAAFAEKKLEWHFIGLIQSNKTRKIAEHFSWVHSLTDKHIAERLNEQRPSGLPPLNICLQVNLHSESMKQGMPAEQTAALMEYCAVLPRLKIRGLMAIPAPKENFKEQRMQFAKLNALFHELNEKHYSLDTLSMGMSNDMKAAIAEGGTLVRIGTAIFGTRASS